MRNVKLYKNEEDPLFFILEQFIITHGMDECKNIYEKELKLAKRLIDGSKKEFTKGVQKE